MVYNAISIVLSIFCLMAVGALMTSLRWMTPERAPLIRQFVINIALPALIVGTMLTKFTRETLGENLLAIGLSYALLGAITLLGLLAARLMRIPEKRRGAFVVMFSYSNSVFIGMPVVTALFGDAAIPFALSYYIANTSFFWTVGNALLMRDGGVSGKPDLRKLLPPPVLFFFAGVLLLLLNIPLPKFLMSTCTYLGNTVTPLSLVYSGYVLTTAWQQRGAGGLRWERGYGLAMAGRFVIAPLLMLGITALAPITALARETLVMQAAMPVMTQTAIVAGVHGGDEGYVAGGTALTTLASLAVIPLYMLLLSKL